jgi:co-chaperonin GroES (HSP10)
MKDIAPKQDFVLIEVVEKGKDDGMTKTKSGLYLLGKEAAKTTAGFGHSTHKFVVRGVGPEVKDIKVDDLVLFSDHYANSIKDDDDRLLVLLKEQYIYATYQD